MIKILPIKNWLNGWINKIEDRSIPRGAFSNGLNWLLKGDKIELRRGSKILGTALTGTGSVNGIHIGYKNNGDEILFRAYSTKLLYSTDDGVTWTEIGTDILYNEPVTFANYSSPAGNQVWVCSPNQTRLIKIMTANPGSYTDVYLSTNNYCGYITTIKNRLWLWGYKKAPSNVYLSHIDAFAYTTVTNEAFDTGDGGKNYSGTLAFKAAGARRTCFNIIVTNETGTTETFVDNRDGTLTGSLGGTGTINYTSGVIAVSFFNNIASGEIRCTYQWEDSATNGIADFTYSGTRVAGEGTFFPQNEGAEIQNIFTIFDAQYVLHRNNVWYIKLTADDTDAINEIWRDNVGIPYFRAATPTGEGIYAIDDRDKNDTKIRLISYSTDNDQIVPTSISDSLDLSAYLFDYSDMIIWGDYLVISCRTTNSTYNNRIILYNRLWKKFDVPQNYNANCFAILSGSLVAGDSISKNAWLLFSGYDDDDAEINNEIELNFDSLDTERLKKVKRIRIQGEIQKWQSFILYAKVDNGGYIELGTLNGTDSQVDTGQSVTIGSTTLGRYEIGGGSVITAYNYDVTLNIAGKLDKFQRIKLKIEATGLGYLSVSEVQYYDIRAKEMKPPIKYR